MSAEIPPDDRVRDAWRRRGPWDRFDAALKEIITGRHEAGDSAQPNQAQPRRRKARLDPVKAGSVIVDEP